MVSESATVSVEKFPLNLKNMYENRTTQESQILDLLISSKGAGVYSYQLAAPVPRGLGILQYNARIYGLRHKGYKIVSDRKGHYVLEANTVTEKTNESKMTQTELDEKLADLRGAYKRASSEGEKKLIVTRANYLKRIFAETQPKEEYATPESAAEIFKA
jgi:hypothetical protein